MDGTTFLGFAGPLLLAGACAAGATLRRLAKDPLQALVQAALHEQREHEAGHHEDHGLKYDTTARVRRIHHKVEIALKASKRHIPPDLFHRIHRALK